MNRNQNDPAPQRLSFPAAFKRIMLMAKPEWKTLALATVFLFLGSGMGLAFPQGVRVMLDGAINDGMGSVNNTALAIVGVFFVFGLASGLRNYLFTIVGYRIVTKLQSQTYSHIIQQEIGFFDQQKTGELMSRLASDTTVLQNAVSYNTAAGFQNLIFAVGGFAFLILTSPILTLLMLVLVPPVSFGAVWFGRILRRLSREVQDALARAGEIAEETISGIRAVRAFVREDYESEKYRNAVGDALVAVKKRTISASIYQGVLTFAGYASVALVLWYGSTMVIKGEMTIGELTSFIIYTLIIASSLSALGALWAAFMRATGAAERIFELLDRETAISNCLGRRLSSVHGRLEFKNVDFAYPSRPEIPALKNISLVIQPGEVVALVGPSGSGKSTIASLISRFYDPLGGQILLDHQPIIELEPSWLRQQIGIVPQEPNLFSASIFNNIAYAKDGMTAEQIQAAARVANAHEFIEKFPQGYETEVGERGVRLSGGQKQRIAIARAVLKDPKILILDEATSALDAQSEHLVKDAIDHLSVGRTTIIIAHRLSTVKDADRVLVIDMGQILEEGRHEELMAREGGLYRNLIERQFFVNAGS